MSRVAPCPPVASLLDCRPRGVAARRARILDALLAETVRMLHRGPLGPDVEEARERAGALLWTIGAPVGEPDEALLAWLVAKGLDAGEEIAPVTMPEPPGRVSASRRRIGENAARRRSVRDAEGERTRPPFRFHGRVVEGTR